MSSGGARIGAGRPGWKLKAEDLFQLDARVFHRLGLFDEPDAGMVRCGDQEVDFRFDGLVLAVRFQVDGRRRSQTVGVTRTACPLGGSRAWLVCTACGGRKLVLYWTDRAFTCRACGSVAYTSQSKEVFGRSWRRQRALERKLGPDGSRPARMHRVTYQVTRVRISACLRRRQRALIEWGARAFPWLQVKWSR